MATCDVEQLMADAKCFMCLGHKESQIVLLQLLCELQAGIESLVASIPATGPTVADLVYATPLTLDFDGADYQRLALTGVINFSASTNRPGAGFAKAIAVVVTADGSNRALSVNANWTCIGAVPTQVTANKTGVLSLTALGPAETDVIYVYQEEA